MMETVIMKDENETALGNKIVRNSCILYLKTDIFVL